MGELNTSSWNKNYNKNCTDYNTSCLQKNKNHRNTQNLKAQYNIKSLGNNIWCWWGMKCEVHNPYIKPVDNN